MKRQIEKRSNTLQHHIFVCCGSSCRKEGAEDIVELFQDIIKDLGLKEHIIVSTTHCNDCCKHSPVVMVYPDGIWYKTTGKKTARRIIIEHLLQQKPVEDHIFLRLAQKTP